MPKRNRVSCVLKVAQQNAGFHVNLPLLNFLAQPSPGETELFQAGQVCMQQFAKQTTPNTMSPTLTNESTKEIIYFSQAMALKKTTTICYTSLTSLLFSMINETCARFFQHNHEKG